MSNEEWLKIPYFSKGRADSLERALTTGMFKDGLDKVLYFFATDTKQWMMVDTNKTIYKINSYEGQPTPPGPGGEGNVKRVDQLPPIIEGDTSTLYIMGRVVYSFDGTGYYPTYSDIENKIGNLPPNVSVVDYINSVREEAIASAEQYTNQQTELHVMYDD